MYPTKHEIQELLMDYDLAPVFYEVLSDTYTPVHLFNALKAGNETCFILESVDNSQQWGRYSFIGIRPKLEVRIEQGEGVTVRDGKASSQPVSNPIGFLQGILERTHSPSVPNRPKFTGGLVGFFGYDTVRYLEKKLTSVPEDDLHLPDCHLFLFDEVVAFDHLSNKTVIILNVYKDGDLDAQYAACETRAKELAEQIRAFVPAPAQKKASRPCRITSNLTKEEFLSNVEKAKEYIRAGDIFQVVLSQRFEAENPPDPFDVYRVLRATNPSPYLYYLQCPSYQIVGASPEMLVNVTKGVVTTRPIAGTSPRGVTPELDAENETKLLNDPKEKAEHTMLVDLGRNDVGKVSKFGTVEVTRLMQVERFSKVMHLVSDVKGILQEGKTAVDALMAVLPAGTLSGAPKVRAMEIIDELENKKRCLYGGTVGYLGFDGNIDTCIAIRTALFKDNRAYIQAGGGIVADSVPEKEFEESRNKAQAVIHAIEEAAKL